MTVVPKNDRHHFEKEGKQEILNVKTEVTTFHIKLYVMYCMLISKSIIDPDNTFQGVS